MVSVLRSFFSVCSSHYITRFLSLALIIFSVTACDFNVELNDERRVLEKIEATSPCDSLRRSVKKKSGSHLMRMFLVDSKKEAIDLDGIDQEPFNFSVSSFKVTKYVSLYKTGNNKGKVKKDFKPKVVAEQDGSNSGMTVTLSIDTKTELGVYPNPRQLQLQEVVGNQRVPKAVSLLIDMSETAAKQDNNTTRTSTPAAWILDHFNGESQIGDIDIFQAWWVKNDRVGPKDNIFKGLPKEEQYLDLKSKARGFLYTTEDENDGSEDGYKTVISRKFTNTLNASAVGAPPLYEAIFSASSDLRIVSKEGKDPFFNPAVIAISLERDLSIINGNKKYPNLQEAIKVSKGASPADMIPLMAILYPRPEEAKIEEWETHQDNLCKIIRAAGDNVGEKFAYFGQLMHVQPSPNNYAKSLRTALDMAYHGQKGFLEFKIKYNLSAAPAKNAVIIFSLEGELLGAKTDNDNMPRILIQVKKP